MKGRSGGSGDRINGLLTIIMLLNDKEIYDKLETENTDDLFEYNKFNEDGKLYETFNCEYDKFFAGRYELFKVIKEL